MGKEGGVKMWLFYVMGAILTVGGMWLAFNLVRGLWAVATRKAKLVPLTDEDYEDEDLFPDTTTNPLYSDLPGNIGYIDED